MEQGPWPEWPGRRIETALAVPDRLESVFMSKNGAVIDVLAIGAHPDDAEIHAGGTLLRMAALGYQTGILDMTRGESSTRGTPEERALEAAQAARVLGLLHRETLDLGDGRLVDTLDARTALVAAFRRLRPRIILTHHWEEPHPDHVATAQIVRAAAYLAGLAAWSPTEGVERYRPHAILHFGLPRWVPPSLVVDVSDWAERKEQAIRCHASQLHAPGGGGLQTSVSAVSFLNHVDARHRSYGALIQETHAEAFFVREALVVNDPVQLFPRPMGLFQ